MLRNVFNLELSSAGLSETNAVSIELLADSLCVGVEAPVDDADDVLSLVVELSLEVGLDMVEDTGALQSDDPVIPFWMYRHCECYSRSKLCNQSLPTY